MPEDDDANTIAGSLTGEAALNSTAAVHGILPGALRMLAVLLLMTRDGRRPVTMDDVNGFGVCAQTRAYTYLAQLAGQGLIRRKRATATDSALHYMTARGADIARAYLLAAERAKRATARRLRDFA